MWLSEAVTVQSVKLNSAVLGSFNITDAIPLPPQPVSNARNRGSHSVDLHFLFQFPLDTLSVVIPQFTHKYDHITVNLGRLRAITTNP